MVREMIGGCCVCLDERGWNENPLVYCDGNGCTVAVHQACYGIVKVPSGPWFCCKCRSQERVARVKCELCPQKDGALKKTDSGGWAHVVCALYIPEVRFGDVSTMEPIIFSSVPNERFTKTCYICEERNKESAKSHGACMNCHKSGCKLSFHVTCAQSKRQLCEEASLHGHVQYVGYCTNHWQKRMKSLNVNGNKANLTPIETEQKRTVKEKKPSRVRNESTSSTNSLDIPFKQNPSRGRKSKSFTECDLDYTRDSLNSSHSLSKSPKEFSEDEHSSTENTSQNGQCGRSKSSKSNFSVHGILGPEKDKKNSPLNTPVHNGLSNKDNTISGSRKRLKSTIDEDSDLELNIELSNELLSKKKKTLEKEKSRSKEKEKTNCFNEGEKSHVTKGKKKKEKYLDNDKKKKEKLSDKKKRLPQPTQLSLLENGKVSTWATASNKMKETPDNFQAFLEHQWYQSAHFITSKAQSYDVASLLGCLHQLKAENNKLEQKLNNLQLRRERLLGLNERLAASFTDGYGNSELDSSSKKTPLSAMLSRLKESCTNSSSKGQKNNETENNKKNDRKKLKSEDSLKENDMAVASSDLAMLAAASVKHDVRPYVAKEASGKLFEHDEKPQAFPSYNATQGDPFLLQPEFGFRVTASSLPISSNTTLNGVVEFDQRKQQIHSRKESPLS